ncbi:hypothetical protein, partial [Paenibacillus sp. KS1]|uniref:hypothetical protein n=1 Tax=Paenibacillus sp. KS1 TaxID=1849249 RepID=UPI0011120354
MVTDKEYRLLSSKAYDDFKTGSKLPLKEEYPDQNNWIVLKVSDYWKEVLGGTGFDATVFGRLDKNDKFSGEAVVAFRGTYSLLDIQQDIDMFLIGDAAGQHIRTRNFVKSLLSNNKLISPLMILDT